MTEITIDMLNDDQRTAYEGIVELFTTQKPAIAVLSGPAGTGKTAVCNCLAKKLRPQLSAMTHKAAAVMSSATGKGVSTLAKVMKHKKFEDYDKGEVRFKASDDVELTDSDTLFIDESSMTNEDNFNEVIEKLGGRYNILFIGDEFQLPPVNEDRSLALTNGYPTFKLRQIMRSKEGSGIQKTSIAIREAMEQEALAIPGMADILADHDDIEWIREEEAFPRMIEDFKAVVDVNDVRMISFTNARVEQFNYHLKQHVTGVNEKLAPGDMVMSNNTYSPRRSVVVENGYGIQSGKFDTDFRIQNNDSLSIAEIDEGEFLGFEVYWITTVQFPQMHLPVPKDRAALDRRIKQLGNEARQLSGQARKDTYREMFNLIESFADLRLNYAQTVHKSQGSTYKTCYFDLQALNSDSLMGKKLLYTGVTRASEKLVLFK